MRIAVRAFERTAARAGYEMSIPFRDHTSWKTYWLQRGASGSWQARRELLSELFDRPYALLVAAQDRALESSLAEGVSP